MTFTKTRAFVAAATIAIVCGCDYNATIQMKIQSTLDAMWSDPAKNAQIESQAEANLKTKLDAELDGKEFEAPGPNPYVHHVKSVTVELGTRSPKITVTNANVTETSTAYYIDFDWAVDWAKGNGGKLDVALDLRSHSFWLAYGYPDHTVHVGDMSVTADGHALAVVQKSGGPVPSTITFKHANVDLTAKAAGWFWTIDVSNTVKGNVQDELVRDVIGKSIDWTVNP